VALSWFVDGLLVSDMHRRTTLDALVTRIEPLLSSRTWRDLIAIVACALTVAACSGGLVYVWVSVQIGVVAGLLVGLICATEARAAVSALVGTALGLAFGPAGFAAAVSEPAQLTPALWSVAVAICVAAAVRFLASRKMIGPATFTWIAIAVLVGNLWATTLIVNAKSMYNPLVGRNVPSMNSRLAGNIPPDLEGSDHVLYLRVYEAVRAGEAYYPSFRKYFIRWGQTTPSSVLNIRSPILTYFWAALPGPRWIVVSFLVLATAVIFLVPVFLSGMVRRPLAIPACATLAAYFLYFPRQLPLFTTEAWAVLLVMMSVAASSVSSRSERWRSLTVVSVGLATVALAVRETMVFVLAAGLFSALVVPGEQRRFRSAAWAAGLAAAGVALGVHYWAASSVVDPASKYQALIRGGLDNALAALSYATDHLGMGGWFAFTLAALGLIGTLLIPEVRLRLQMSLATFMPLVAFLFIGNNARENRVGMPLNYWGVVVVPLVYLCIPLVFRLLPGGAPTDPVKARRA